MTTLRLNLSQSAKSRERSQHPGNPPPLRKGLLDAYTASTASRGTGRRWEAPPKGVHVCASGCTFCDVLFMCFNVSLHDVPHNYIGYALWRGCATCIRRRASRLRHGTFVGSAYKVRCNYALSLHITLQHTITLQCKQCTRGNAVLSLHSLQG